MVGGGLGGGVGEWGGGGWGGGGEQRSRWEGVGCGFFFTVLFTFRKKYLIKQRQTIRVKKDEKKHLYTYTDTSTNKQ